MIKHSFFLTEKQQETLLIEAKNVGAETIPEFIDKAIHLTKLFANALAHGCEFVIIDNEAKVLEDPNGRIAIVGPKTSVVFATDKIKQTLEIEQKIRESNNFGYPIDEYKA